ncbi:HNH endonuclease [Achromobacter xylosoxidans]
MLFSYTYVPHQMEKMQVFIDFIFHEVWCKAPVGLVFHPDLFDGCPELKEVMGEFGFSAQAAERGKAFYKDVKAIYDLFASLSPTEIDQFKLWYQGNNDLEKVCANDPATHLARYADIAVNHKELADQLGIFFKGLYSQSLLGLAALRAKIGDIDDHYQAFVSTNKAGKCPFCGIDDIKGKNHSEREAYDHYLPKALYPFNSINFRNLAPACHECNSTYKLSKDPVHSAVGRRKAFYPYAVVSHTIELQVTLQHADFDKLKHADITIQLGPAELAEELDTWKHAYGIEERYRAKICTENNGKYWLTQVLDEWKTDGRDPADFMATLARQVQRNPYAECNFLKMPFLDACRQAGAFYGS